MELADEKPLYEDSSLRVAVLESGEEHWLSMTKGKDCPLEDATGYILQRRCGVA